MTRSELNQKILDAMTAAMSTGIGVPATEADLRRNTTFEGIVDVLVLAGLVTEDPPSGGSP